MKLKMNVSLILSMAVLLLCLNALVYSASLYGEIERRSALVKSTPYAVRYKISEKNFITELLQEGVAQGVARGLSMDPNLTTAAGVQLTSDCLYVTDGQGNERFDYYSQGIPLDLRVALPIPLHVSLFKTPSECISRSYRSNGKFYRGGAIFYPDYMSENNYPTRYRYPVFGLGIISREEKNGLIYLDDAVKMEGGVPTPETLIDVTRIHLDPEACKVEICWGEKSLPQDIIYNGNDGNWGWEVNVLETGEKDGYAYPQNAKFTRKINQPNILHPDSNIVSIVEIEVIDFIVGPGALEKYPVLAPPFGENDIITDFRTYKK